MARRASHVEAAGKIRGGPGTRKERAVAGEARAGLHEVSAIESVTITYYSAERRQCPLLSRDRDPSDDGHRETRSVDRD